MAATTPSPMSRIVAKLENNDPMVWETMIVTLVLVGGAVCHPELSLYCQFDVAVMVWFPRGAFVGMRMGMSTILFAPAVKLSGKPDVT
jgi:hypothetical protein